MNLIHVPLTQPDHVKIVGIDPGSTNLGYCRLTFSAQTCQILETTAKTITANRNLGLDQNLALIHGERYARIEALCRELLFNLYQDLPNFIVCESPFYNPGRPSAYGVLMEVLSAIRNTVYQYHPLMVFELIDPSSAKNAVGASGGAKKEVMQKAVLQMPGLQYNGLVPQNQLDEHSIDAIAVAMSKYRKCLSYFS